MEGRRHQPLPLGASDGLPYSKGLMARRLLLAGMPPTTAYELARRLERDLDAAQPAGVELARVEELARELLDGAAGEEVAARLRRQDALERLPVPIVLMLGGATGTGKSTVATDAAYRLGITRVSATDFIRETIRAFFPPPAMPAVHCSSFEVGGSREEIEAGFLEQTRLVLPGIEAAIGRALREGWSIVVEGVHLVPGMVPSSIEGALVVHAVLQVASVELHRERFSDRESLTGGLRAMDKYLDSLGAIRLVQDCIVSRAERHGVAVIESSQLERAADALLDLVFAASEQLQAELVKASG